LVPELPELPEPLELPDAGLEDVELPEPELADDDPLPELLLGAGEVSFLAACL
jgi:hypothetical protein